MFHDKRFKSSRRTLMSFTSAAVLAGIDGASAVLENTLKVDGGEVSDGRVTFSRIAAQSEAAPNTDLASLPKEKRVGFAVVALGRLSVEEILPAFATTRLCHVAALCSGDPVKLKHLGERYGVPSDSLYSYEGFDRIAENNSVQVVYIVLPNSMHKDMTLRAAAAKKHVLCEKPMANSIEEAQQMIAACTDAGVRLMIAYRCRYQPHHLELIKKVKSGEFGPPKIIEAVNAQNQGNPEQWRLKKALAGGGALPDIGLYCLNAARATLGEEPIEVEGTLHSTPGDARFNEVEETVAWLMRFPSGAIANLSTSYGVHRASRLAVHLDRGSLVLDNAFAYRGQMLRVISAKNEIETDTALQIAPRDQFAAEMDHMAECVLSGRRPDTPGEEGLRDQILMDAIYRSASSRTPVRV